MKMISGTRALDKIYKRRDRYEIPEWQRGEVWDRPKKQQLIDSILRGWKLPKFYLRKLSEDEYEVVDGQQRLTAIYEFFGNELQLTARSAEEFGGTYYKDLPIRRSDAFDDFEIEYDEIEDAEEEEIKQFFKRLQDGLPLTTSEKLNAVHSNLRNFAMELAKHSFFTEKVSVADTRYAHFDIVVKVAATAIEGIDAGLRYEDLLATLENQRAFAGSSAIGKKLKATFDYLDKVFPTRSALLRNRTIVQALATLAGRLVETGRADGHEARVREFCERFMGDLARQVELGQSATDEDYIRFQRTVNANVKSGARTRQEILLRKLLTADPILADVFDPAVVLESGLSGRVKELGESITQLIGSINTDYASKHGEDLFKATNKTTQALARLGKPVKEFSEYESLLEDLYFVFHEGVGQRLGADKPESFQDVNMLRTELNHDLDHGEAGKAKAKLKKIGELFKKYSGSTSPQTLAPERFVAVQAKLFTALEADLRGLTGK